MFYDYNEKSPKIHETAFIHPTALVVGDVEIDRKSSIWTGCILRGDLGKIRIGEYTCIQDRSILHPGEVFLFEEEKIIHKPITIGSNVLIGKNVVIQASYIGDLVVIESGATIEKGVQINEGAVIGQNSFVPANFVVAPQAVLIGNPARKLRTIDRGTLEQHREITWLFAKYAEQYQTKKLKKR